jgi:hypothetical protein
MPNWCENKLIIRGNKKDVEEFKQKIEENKKDNGSLCIFETYNPMPSELKNTKSPSSVGKAESDQLELIRVAQVLEMKYGASNWYDWALKNWGTKWGCCKTYWGTDNPYSLKEHQDVFEIELFYETAWSPGDDCLKDIFEKLDKLSFFLTYVEEGMGFEGTLFVRNGNTEYSEMRDCIAKDIELFW